MECSFLVGIYYGHLIEQLLVALSAVVESD